MMAALYFNRIVVTIHYVKIAPNIFVLLVVLPFTVCLWLLLWSLLLVIPSFVVVHDFPRLLVSVYVLFVCVCDGVFDG